MTKDNSFNDVTLNTCVWLDMSLLAYSLVLTSHTTVTWYEQLASIVNNNVSILVTSYFGTWGNIIHHNVGICMFVDRLAVLQITFVVVYILVFYKSLCSQLVRRRSVSCLGHQDLVWPAVLPTFALTNCPDRRVPRHWSVSGGSLHGRFFHRVGRPTGLYKLSAWCKVTNTSLHVIVNVLFQLLNGRHKSCFSL